VDAALKALAEPRRREILRLVWSDELPATDIAASFTEVTRSAISQHLGVLREARLVTERREGTRRLYRADHGEMDRLREFLDRYWTDSLSRLRDVAEAAERAGERGDRIRADNPNTEHRQGSTEPWMT
jgi:DNA-binding transcriptional ArsR family regulator